MADKINVLNDETDDNAAQNIAWSNIIDVVFILSTIIELSLRLFDIKVLSWRQFSHRRRYIDIA